MNRLMRPVEAMNAKELMDELVQDAFDWKVTPLERFLPAILRFAVLTHVSANTAMRQYLDACKEKRGDSRLPGFNPGTRIG